MEQPQGHKPLGAVSESKDYPLGPWWGIPSAHSWLCPSVLLSKADLCYRGWRDGFALDAVNTGAPSTFPSHQTPFSRISWMLLPGMGKQRNEAWV